MGHLHFTVRLRIRLGRVANAEERLVGEDAVQVVDDEDLAEVDST